MGKGQPIEHSEKEGLVASFGHALLYSAIEEPYQGVAQLVNHSSNTEWLPKQVLIDAPQPADFQSANWYAQTMGGAIGTAAKFIALSKLMRGHSTDLAQTTRLSGMTGTEAAKVGFVMQGVFSPSAENDMLPGRLKNAVTSAVTMASLTKISHGFNGLSRSSAGLTVSGLELPLARQLTIDVGAGALAGIISAETHSVLNGKGFASGRDIYESAFGFGIVGGALGGANRLARQSTVGTEKYAASTAYEAEASPLRSTLLTSLTRTSPQLEPGNLTAVQDAIAKTLLNLPSKNLDLGAWRPAERVGLIKELRNHSEGVMANEGNITRLISTLDKASVNTLGKELGALRQEGAADAQPNSTLESAANLKSLQLQESLQTALNSSSKAMGLTSLEVVLDNSLPANIKGFYTVGTGKLTLNEAMFHKGLTAEAVDYIAHESTHFEVDILKMRSVLDKQGASSDLSTLSAAYGSNLSQPFVDNVISLRDGKPLTAEQTRRLEAIDKSRQSYAAGPGVLEIVKVDQTLQKMAEKFSHSSPTQQTKFIQQAQELYTRRATATDNYVGAKFELEAWSNGVLAHVKARALGLPEAAQDPVIFSHPLK
ncbi:hypothetical protein BH10CYA1_BH10CYA1_58290 [soil metagenome]